MKELLVLCAHEPTIDPRIDWAARAARNAGYKVWIHGWTAGHAKPKAKDPSGCETTRAMPESPRPRRREVLGEALGLVHPVLLALLAPVAAIVALAWAIYRLVLAPWVVLDYAMEKIGLERRTTRRVEAVFALLRHWLFHLVNRLSSGSLLRHLAGLVGYRWYLLEHAVDNAGALLREIESRGHAPDIIHANDPDTLLGAALVKKRYGSRLVYDAHEFGPDAYLMEPRPRAFFFLYERLMLDHVDAAVTVTPQIAEKFNRLYVESLPFRVVPNATPLPDPEELEPQDDPQMEAAAQGRVRFLFQGGYAVNRGVEQVIDEFCRIDEDKAVLFLRGPENAYRKTLIAHAEKTGRLDRSIFFLPSIGEDRLIASAVNADVGLIPYRSCVENHLGACPNKLSQYMQAGILVIANRLPFVAGVVEAAECGLLYDDTEDGDLAAQMRRAVDDPILGERLGRNGQDYARRIYNYETYFPVLQGLYEDLGPIDAPPHAGRATLSRQELTTGGHG